MTPEERREQIIKQNRIMKEKETKKQNKDEDEIKLGNLADDIMKTEFWKIYTTVLARGIDLKGMFGCKDFAEYKEKSAKAQVLTWAIELPDIWIKRKNQILKAREVKDKSNGK